MNNQMKTNQKKEALRRIKALGLEKSVAAQFKEDGTVFYSERIKMGAARVGILYWMRNQQHFMDAMQEFEEETGCMVYHATHEYTEFGECLTMLYVPSDEEEWEMDNELFKEGSRQNGYEQYAKVVNLTEPTFSEIGMVAVKASGGGLIRVA